jgi:hypothetical protein
MKSVYILKFGAFFSEHVHSVAVAPTLKEADTLLKKNGYKRKKNHDGRHYKCYLREDGFGTWVHVQKADEVS